MTIEYLPGVRSGLNATREVEHDQAGGIVKITDVEVDEKGDLKRMVTRELRAPSSESRRASPPPTPWRIRVVVPVGVRYQGRAYGPGAELNIDAHAGRALVELGWAERVEPGVRPQLAPPAKLPAVTFIRDPEHPGCIWVRSTRIRLRVPLRAGRREFPAGHEIEIDGRHARRMVSMAWADFLGPGTHELPANDAARVLELRSKAMRERSRSRRRLPLAP